MRARGGRAGRRSSRGRGVRQDALREPVSSSPSLTPSTSALSLALQFAGTLRQIQSCSKLAPFFLGLRVCRGGSIQRAVRRMAGGGSGGRKSSVSARVASGDATASCSGVRSFSPLLDDHYEVSSSSFSFNSSTAISVPFRFIVRGFFAPRILNSAGMRHAVLRILSRIGQGSEATSASDKLSARVPCSRGPDDEMSLSPSLFAYFLAA